MTSTIVLASSNPGKIQEFADMFGGLAITVRPQSDWQINAADETGLTFVENALIKARHASEQSGLPALADDSGLVVDALNGAPGIYSSRYGGPNADEKTYTQKLLDDLKDVPTDKRSARFVCVLVYLRHALDPIPLIAQATWEGSILTQRQGSGGFGYDPVFYVPEKGCAAAELSAAQKHALSHRGKALKMLLQLYQQAHG